MEILKSGIPKSYLSTDGTMAANSDVKVPTEKAIVTYVAAGSISSTELETRLGSGEVAGAPTAAVISALPGRMDTAETDLTSGDEPGHDHTSKINHSLATAANDFLAASGSGAYVKKTLAETQTILGVVAPTGAAQAVGTYNNPLFSNLFTPLTGTGPVQNLLTYSCEFDNGSWTKSAGVTYTANSAAFPGGLATAAWLDADTLITAGGAGDVVSKATTNSTTGNYVFSVWLWVPSGSATITIGLGSSGGAGGDAEVTASCELTTTPKRFFVTQNLATGHTTKTVYIHIGTTTVIAWGAQLHQGTVPIQFYVTRSTNYIGYENGVVLGGGLNSTLTARLPYTHAVGYYNISGVSIGSSISAYAAGSAYSLTATPALLDFGTTDPSITLTANANYRLTGGCVIQYNGATFAANQTVTIKLRKTSGTAADVTNAVRGIITEVITTGTKHFAIVELPPVTYSTTTADVIQLWGDVAATPSAGSLDVVSAYVQAVVLQ